VILDFEPFGLKYFKPRPYCYTRKKNLSRTCAVGVPKTPLQNLDLVWFIYSFVTPPRYFVTTLTVNIAKLKVA